MNAPLPRVVCKHCNKSMTYRRQHNCDHCGHHLSQWHIAAQLKGSGAHVHIPDGQIGDTAPTPNIFPKSN